MFEKVSWEIVHFLLALFFCRPYSVFTTFCVLTHTHTLLQVLPLFANGFFSASNSLCFSSTAFVMFDASDMKSIFVYIKDVVIPFLLIKSNPILQ